MSLRASLNLLITALLLLVLLLGTLLLFKNARNQVQAEVESVSAVVLQLADPVSVFFSRPYATANPNQNNIGGIEHLRHIRVEFVDQSGRVLASNVNKLKARKQERVPAWFMEAMTRNLTPLRVERDVMTNGTWIGKVIIEADPSYEVSEVWEDSMGLLSLVGVFFVAVNMLVYWAVGRALKPLGSVMQALTEIERGHLDARLPPFELKELSGISDKFNGMAQTLEISISNNHRLSQQLIYLQEEERKSLARDLHDELGQSLTAILADGHTLLKLSEEEFPKGRPCAQAVVDVTKQVMVHLRSMLQRLRPDVLDGLGLNQALEELITVWHERNEGVFCQSDITGDYSQTTDKLRITVYRVLQESLTNITRHAGAKRVNVRVTPGIDASGKDSILIDIDDDGKGFDLTQSNGGFGLSGMAERVEGIGGKLVIQSSRGGGTRISVSIPLAEEGVR